jgi:hypothetical protein
MKRFKRLDQWLRRNYNFALCIGLLLGFLAADLWF